MKHIKTVLPTLILSILLPVIATDYCFAQVPGKAPNKNLNTKPLGISKSATRQTKKKEKAPADGELTSPDKKKTANISEKRRAELLNFCEEHHKELLPLLESLRKKRPLEFERALRTLDREIIQLQAWQSRSEERYEKLLNQWVLRSKIKLLSAKLAIRGSLEQRAKAAVSLEKMLGRLLDMKVSNLVDDRKAAASRIAKLNTQIEQLKSTRDTEIKKQMDAFMKNAERIRASQKTKSAAKNKSNNSDKQSTTKQEQTKKNQTKTPENKKE